MNSQYFYSSEMHKVLDFHNCGHGSKHVYSEIFRMHHFRLVCCLWITDHKEVSENVEIRYAAGKASVEKCERTVK